MRIPIIIVLLAALIGATRVSALEIAPVEQALTLAQFEQAGKVHSVLVLADDEAVVTGLDISAHTGAFPDDSLSLVSQFGYEALAGYRTLGLPQLSIPHERLRPASGESMHNIAAGINYAEHGVETEIETGPFLFPKIARGTGSRELIATDSDQLLDYEVELCARFDRDIRNANDIEAVTTGVFLCGDFTDRAQLMRLIDTSDLRSGIGFTDAKSKPGYMPSGPYLVVPRDWKSFLDQIQLRLSLNGESRQAGQAGQVSDMILPVDRLVAQALESGSEKLWQFEGMAVSLLPEKSLDKGVVLLTGTPEGVIFRPPSGGYKFRKILQYVVTGSFLWSGPVQYVIEQYISDSLREKNYLQPGDQVSLYATYLGSIVVKVSAVQSGLDPAS